MAYTIRPDRVARAHHALAEVSRLRLLDVLRAHEEGLDAAAAATEVGLHITTARGHLEMLVEAGLVERAVERRTVRGRPRVLYHARPDRGEEGGEGYRLLAEMLATLVETSMRRPADRAEAAGAAWGRSLVDRARPQARMTRAEAMRRLRLMLDDLGFEPEVERRQGRDRVLLRRCPFREVAAHHRTVVCSAHLGLIKGALDELGVDAEAATLDPLVTPTLCVAEVAGPRP